MCLWRCCFWLVSNRTTRHHISIEDYVERMAIVCPARPSYSFRTRCLCFHEKSVFYFACADFPRVHFVDFAIFHFLESVCCGYLLHSLKVMIFEIDLVVGWFFSVDILESFLASTRFLPAICRQISSLDVRLSFILCMSAFSNVLDELECASRISSVLAVSLCLILRSEFI